MIDKETFELIADLKEELKACQLNINIFVDDTEVKINRAEEWLIKHQEAYELLNKPLIPFKFVQNPE